MNVKIGILFQDYSLVLTALLILAALAMGFVVVVITNPNFHHTGKGVASARTQRNVVFDVPALIGKSIDEVRRVLGPPDDDRVEPTSLQLRLGIDEWSNVFTNDGVELVVTYRAENRMPVEFFVPGNNRDVLMQIANVSDGNSSYQVKPVKMLRDPTKITGIRIIPDY